MKKKAFKRTSELVTKCFTVRQPWAHLIMSGQKDVENRAQRTKYQGRVAVRVSSTMDASDQANVRKYKLNPEKLPRGVVIGTVELYDCVRNSERRCAQPGMWHWLLKNPRPLKKHKRMKGWLGLFPMKRAIRIG